MGKNFFTLDKSFPEQPCALKQSSLDPFGIHIDNSPAAWYSDCRRNAAGDLFFRRALYENKGRIL